MCKKTLSPIQHLANMARLEAQKNGLLDGRLDKEDVRKEIIDNINKAANQKLDEDPNDKAA